MTAPTGSARPLTAVALVCSGYTIPAQGGTYWTGEAMETTDFKDLDQVPEAVASTTAALARNAVHLATALRDDRYPPYQ